MGGLECGSITRPFPRPRHSVGSEPWLPWSWNPDGTIVATRGRQSRDIGTLGDIAGDDSPGKATSFKASSFLHRLRVHPVSMSPKVLKSWSRGEEVLRCRLRGSITGGFVARKSVLNIEALELW